MKLIITVIIIKMTTKNKNITIQQVVINQEDY